MPTPHAEPVLRSDAPAASSPSSLPLPAAGDSIDERYRLDREAGRTDAGVVFDATDLTKSKRVAVELASSIVEPKARRKWTRDAMLAQRLEGEHVLRVLDVGALGSGVPYVVREATLGTLANELASKGAIPVAQAAAWTLEACEAIAEAHALGMAHGDLRLDNIYLVRGTPEPRVKVAWISAAKAERAASEDVLRDIGSLGFMMRALVTGHLDEEDDGATTLPSDLARTVARALAQPGGAAFHDVSELATALAPFAPAGHASARTATFLLSRAAAGPARDGVPASGRSSSSAGQKAQKAHAWTGKMGAKSMPPPPLSEPKAHAGDRISITDEWFGKPQPVALVEPPIAPAPPKRRGGAFTLVSLALVGAALGGSLLLWESGRLPHWTGAAPPDAVGTTEVTSAEENAKAVENAKADESANAKADESAKAEADESAKAEADESAKVERAKGEAATLAALKSTPVEALPAVEKPAKAKSELRYTDPADPVPALPSPAAAASVEVPDEPTTPAPAATSPAPAPAATEATPSTPEAPIQNTP